MRNNPVFKDTLVLICFAVVILSLPWLLIPIGADYPDLLQKIAIFGIFAIGFNILFGLTGYLSFGHAAFIGVGSYTALWSFKLLTMNVLPAIIFAVIVAGIFALLIGYVSLRRSGIYFSILTLAFAQMCYSLAYSVLTPITNGETGLQTRAIRSNPETSLLDGDIRIIDQALGIQEIGVPTTNFFGLDMSGYSGFFFCAVILIICFFIAQCITRSNFGMMLKAIKSNQNRLNYTGIHTRPYLIAAFVISGMYAGLAGALMAVTDPIAGAERMQWTASGEVVLMTILGGVGTLVGPVLGAALIKYAEQKVSSWNEGILSDFFSFLPEPVQEFLVSFTSLFVGEGWHMALGLMFMVIVIFLPGGLMEGFRRLSAAFRRPQNRETAPRQAGKPSDAGATNSPQPAE
ncbi:branched-chain amino acid ABC transporter permease [Nitratireductor mangrovi]|uniref:Branched-chain amino acid ABC transporter permease n=1 Tax=Nitratireductor mangrovi TaxID=2599600 RepID=A0A5B8KZ85_9HYPH|nr:branched-chain amino acid ABC transporter permease [Nitratireductor mangrovi]QDZ00901.1 branched-chain amino acid ABC transporter permease [Nitratireductor mangrovi]